MDLAEEATGYLLMRVLELEAEIADLTMPPPGSIGGAVRAEQAADGRQALQAKAA